MQSNISLVYTILTSVYFTHSINCFIEINIVIYIRNVSYCTRVKPRVCIFLYPHFMFCIGVCFTLSVVLFVPFSFLLSFLF
jgi:hypothetical protein